ncbi:hypothetical protein ACFYL6_20710 [Micromonospora sp. NPDC007208]|uniref:hypothetical protein n=1 Tax=Micromonospora sp. NPDC007208 TaxID=3364236 RepID=UPI003685F81E
MSPRVADLGDVIAYFQPGPTSPPPTGPGTGSGSRPGPQVTEKACCQAVLVGERCDCRAMRRQLRAANRQPIFFDFRRAAA